MSLFGLIGGGLAAAGSAIGGLFNKSSQSSANKTNMQLAQYQNEANQAYQQREFEFNSQQSELEYQRNLEKWNMENAYNSPAAQMQRYAEAGLNPNLIYGTGSASAGNASTAPQYTAARYKAPHAERATVSPATFQFDPYQAVQITQALSMQKAQNDNLNAQADLTRQEVKNRQIDNLIKAETLTGSKISNKYRDEQEFWRTLNLKHDQMNKTRQGNLLDLNYDKLRYELDHIQPLQRDKLSSEILNLRVTHDIRAFELELNKIGINTRDPFYARLGARLVNASDSEFASFLRNLLIK